MISVVIPVFNEAENLPSLYERLTRASADWGEDYEVVLVDDGSSDSSAAVMASLHHRDPRWKVLTLSRNFGHQTAVSAGISCSTGEAVVVMDSDLQDPPEVIASLLAKWRAGYHVVYAIRTKRKEGFFKRSAYYLFYRSLRWMASIDIPLDAGDFCVMDRSVVDVLKSMPERDRFVRGLRSWAGFSQIGVKYERAERHAGHPKYSLTKYLGLASDGIFSFSVVPLKLSSLLGTLLCIVSLFLAGLLVVWRLTDAVVLGMHPTEATGWTSLLCIILFLFGLQFLGLGVLAEYISRIFTEVKGRPPWVISERLGFSPQDPSAVRGSTPQEVREVQRDAEPVRTSDPVL